VGGGDDLGSGGVEAKERVIKLDERPAHGAGEDTAIPRKHSAACRVWAAGSPFSRRPPRSRTALSTPVHCTS